MDEVLARIAAAEAAAANGGLNLFSCENNTEATDAAGDGCDWYDSNPSGCGAYDTSTFTASTMCCACMPVPAPPGGCEHIDYFANDSAGDSCAWYDANPTGCGNYDTSEFIAAEMCCGCGGGVTVLPDPQWNINLDYDQADIYIADLDAEYRVLHEKMGQVVNDWMTDRTVIDNYYWNRKLMPLLEEGAHLDERTMRTVVTWIADGT